MNLNDIYKLLVKLADKNNMGTPYVVGGLPRDIYMRKESIKTTDIDITTNNNNSLRLAITIADELGVLFNVTDNTHATVFTEKFDLDFSSHFISEGAKSMIPKNKLSHIESFSRDFTVNTILLNLKTGELEDPTGMGFSDLDNKILRTPIPVDITLRDDPARAFRAINLAARYDLRIDDDIIDFIKNNKNFISEEVNDRYITVKISKAIIENEELTLDLLNKTGLFGVIPLSGVFKEVLIRRKMLPSYLTKTSSLNTWKKYTKQGPEYNEVKKVWRKLHRDLARPSTKWFRSWEKWYSLTYKTTWEDDPKAPDDIIKDMKNEAAWNSYTSSGDMFKRLKMLWVSLHNKLGQNFDESFESWSDWYKSVFGSDWDTPLIDPSIVISRIRSVISEKAERAKIESAKIERAKIERAEIERAEIERAKNERAKIESAKNESAKNESAKNESAKNESAKNESAKNESAKNMDLSSVSFKAPVSHEGLTLAAKLFAKHITMKAKELGLTKPVITSAYRSYESQVVLMKRNWNKNHSAKGGSFGYITRLYGYSYGSKMDEAFKKSNWKELGVEILKARPNPSYHLKGMALDFRLTPGIKKLIYDMKSEGDFDIKIIDESNTAGPHMHVSVIRKNNTANNRIAILKGINK